MPKKVPIKTKDLPATHGMLLEFRDELKYSMEAGFKRIDARFVDVDAGFKPIDARFGKVDVEFKRIDARFEDVDAGFKRIDARFGKVDAEFKRIDARFGDVDAGFKRIDAQFGSVNARFNSLDGDIADIKSMFHQSMLKFEEQRSENRVVLEALHGLAQRQDRVESEVVEVRDLVRSMAKAKTKSGSA